MTPAEAIVELTALSKALSALYLIADVKDAEITQNNELTLSALARAIEALGQLDIAVDLADDLRCYTHDWDWKHGAYWDEQRLKLPGGAEQVALEHSVQDDIKKKDEQLREQLRRERE